MHKSQFLQITFTNTPIIIVNIFRFYLQVKERIITIRLIEEMFSAHYFDFYRNFWNTRKTIGLSGGDPECIIKKEKIGFILMIKLLNFQK